MRPLLRKFHPTTVYLEDFRPEAEAAAVRWSHGRTRSLAPFLTWCIRQVVRLEFLTPENREFVLGFSSDPLTAINGLVSYVRGEEKAKLLSPFFAVNKEMQGNAAQLAIDFTPRKADAAPLARAKGAGRA